MKAKTCLCLVCFKPKPTWLAFLEKFKAYDVFVVIDDNAVDYARLYQETYPSIHFVQVSRSECHKHGFVDMNYLTKKHVSGWDKAVYYFSVLNHTYAHTWFLEDDVFLYDENVLTQIDGQYESHSLLAPSCTRRHRCRDWYHWRNVDLDFVPRYGSSLERSKLGNLRHYLSELSPGYSPWPWFAT